MATLTRNLQTNAGLDLIRGAVGGENKLIYTSSELYARNISNLTDDKVRELTKVDTPLLACDLKVSNINQKNVTLSAQFTNESLQSDITFKSIGWFATTTVAKAQGKPPVLFAVSQLDSDAHLIAGAQNKSTSFFFAELLMGVSATTQVELVAAEAGYVTIAEMAQTILDLSRKGLIDLGNQLPDLFDPKALHNTSLQYVPLGTVKGLPIDNEEVITGGRILGGYLISLGNNTTAQDGVQIYIDVSTGKMYITYYLNKLNQWTKWLQIGKDGYSKEEVIELLTDYATKGELAQKADLSNVYSKTESDNKLSKELEKALNEVNSDLAKKADANNVYTKAEVDSKLGDGSTSVSEQLTDLQNKIIKDLEQKADKSNVYDKATIDTKLKNLDTGGKVQSVQGRKPDSNGDVNLDGAFPSADDILKSQKDILNNIKKLMLLQNAPENVTDGGKIDLDTADFQKEGFFGFTNAQVTVGSHVFNWLAKTGSTSATLGSALSGWYANISVDGKRLFQAVAVDLPDLQNTQIYTRTFSKTKPETNSNFNLQFNASNWDSAKQFILKEIFTLSAVWDIKGINGETRFYKNVELSLDNLSVKNRGIPCATDIGITRFAFCHLVTNAVQTPLCYINADSSTNIASDHITYDGYVINLPARETNDFSEYMLQIVVAWPTFDKDNNNNLTISADSNSVIKTYYRISYLNSEKPTSADPDKYVNYSRSFVEPELNTIKTHIQTAQPIQTSINFNNELRNSDILDGTLSQLLNSPDKYRQIPLLLDNYNQVFPSLAGKLKYTFSSRSVMTDRPTRQNRVYVRQEFRSAGFIFNRSRGLSNINQSLTDSWELTGTYNPFEDTAQAGVGTVANGADFIAIPESLACILPNGTNLNNVGSFRYTEAGSTNTGYFKPPESNALYPAGVYLLALRNNYGNSPFSTVYPSDKESYRLLVVFELGSSVWQKIYEMGSQSISSYTRRRYGSSWSSWTSSYAF